MSQSKLLFPRTAKYDHNWVMENSLLQNVLYYTESLCEVIELKPGMRILDLCCGRAASSIFMAKEYGVEVYAVDREVSPTENYKRIEEMGCTASVVPLKLNARSLPFPSAYFDVVVAINGFSYFATDEWYLSYLSQFVKPRGLVAVAEWCFAREFATREEVPKYLLDCYLNTGFHSMHSLNWWENHFTKIGLFEIERAEVLPHNDFLMQDYYDHFKDRKSEIEVMQALEKDDEGLLQMFRLIAKRTNRQPFLDDFDYISSR